MTTVKVSELSGKALDYAVAMCEGVCVRWSAPHEQLLREGFSYVVWCPSRDWAIAGPIIEREEIWITGPFRDRKNWKANSGKVRDEDWSASEKQGPTPLIAAMHCYVASKMGESVEIPDNLL